MYSSRRRRATNNILGFDRRRRSISIARACPPCPPCPGTPPVAKTTKPPADSGKKLVTKTAEQPSPVRASHEAVEPIGLSYGTTSVALTSSGDGGDAAGRSASSGSCPVPVRSYCRKMPRSGGSRSRSRSASVSAPRRRRSSRSRSVRRGGGGARSRSRSTAGAAVANDQMMSGSRRRKRSRSGAPSAGGKKRKSAGGSRRKASRRRSGKSNDAGASGSDDVDCSKAIIDRCCKQNAGPDYMEEQDDGDGYEYYQNDEDDHPSYSRSHYYR